MNCDRQLWYFALVFLVLSSVRLTACAAEAAADPAQPGRSRKYTPLLATVLTYHIDVDSINAGARYTADDAIRIAGSIATPDTLAEKTGALRSVLSGSLRGETADTLEILAENCLTSEDTHKLVRIHVDIDGDDLRPYGYGSCLDTSGRWPYGYDRNARNRLRNIVIADFLQERLNFYLTDMLGDDSDEK